MKTNKIYKLIFSIVALVSMASCVQDDDYSIPESLGSEENVKLNQVLQNIENGTTSVLTIEQVKDLYMNSGETAPYQITSNVVVKGYISSSDQSGNLYKEIYMQDASENPTSAITILLNQVDSYNQFNQGREVYVRLENMYVGETALETIAIGGKLDGDRVGQFTAAQIPNYILRSPVTETIVPLNLSIGAVGDQHVGMLVTFDNVQFPESLAGMTYFDSSEDFDTQRIIQACEGFDYSNFILETSSFSNFSQLPLPMGGGSITGIITKSYGGDDLIITLNSVDDVMLDGSRCEPLNLEDFNVVFQDGFDSGLGNWTTYNVLGAQVWGTTNFGNPAPSAYMNGYSSGAQNNEDWLISEAIDLAGVSNTIFFFETDKRYDGNDLEVFISTDYPGGDPNSNGTWMQVDANIDPNANSWNTWTNSGSIDVSSADGQNLFIAFKYTSTTAAASTFELDNVTVLGL